MLIQQYVYLKFELRVCHANITYVSFIYITLSFLFAPQKFYTKLDCNYT